MADYYYAELLFDPDEARLADVVESTVGSLISEGCTFREITVPTGSMMDRTKWGEYTTSGLDLLREMCEEAVSEGLQDGRRLISFPPRWGRIMLEYPFVFDSALNPEIWEEEHDTGSHSTDIGLSFTFSPSLSVDRYTKMTMSLWEDYVLRRGERKTHLKNIRKLIKFFEVLSTSARPYFGVMNSEIHANPDRSLAPLLEGRLPEGNEYVYVGPMLKSKLNMGALMRSGRPFVALPGGSLMIEFTDRWGRESALLGR